MLVGSARRLRLGAAALSIRYAKKSGRLKEHTS